MAMADCVGPVGYGETGSTFGAGSRQKGCGKLVTRDRYGLGLAPTMTRAAAARRGRIAQLAAAPHLVSRVPARYAQALIGITQKAARS